MPLCAGERLRKDNVFFEVTAALPSSLPALHIRPWPMHLLCQAMGDVDELNSCLGVAREFVLASQLSAVVATQACALQALPCTVSWL